MSKESMASLEKKPVDELSEDMEVVGPGQMLSEARNKLSLSTEYVAEKLNFKNVLVKNIEQDLFDQKLPATFNRGYLRSYAKLVNVDVDEVLSAYDMLGVAEVQRSEMQSFSNLTEKEAEHSRLMWLSYFIAALLFGLMILWWQQAPNQTVDENPIKEQTVATVDNSTETEAVTKTKTLTEQEQSQVKIDAPEVAIVLPLNESASQDVLEQSTVELSAVGSEVETIKESIPQITSDESEASVAVISTAVFTFSGDCWVNIFDATGERVAWGVKKSGYVMTVTGKAPLKITLGKPELAAIVFDGELIDMSAFDVGNIAKFTLPLSL
jgi:cytoskeleton protein RodZ